MDTQLDPLEAARRRVKEACGLLHTARVDVAALGDAPTLGTLLLAIGSGEAVLERLKAMQQSERNADRALAATGSAT